ncbi:MAG: hypothetical protein ACKVZH_23465 [Blastocatellia bacterium]
MKSLLVGIKNIVLWSHERGTWQYDVLCLLIIGTVFLVPSKYFGDRDRASVKSVQTSGQANAVRTLASEAGETVREIAVSDLQIFLQKLNKPELMLNSPQEAIRLYLSDKLNQDVTVSKFEPFMNPQTRVNGYRVWTK